MHKLGLTSILAFGLILGLAPIACDSGGGEQANADGGKADGGKADGGKADGGEKQPEAEDAGDAAADGGEGGDEQAAPDASTPEGRVAIAAKVANAIADEPERADAILEENELDREKLDDMMFEIAADAELSKAYREARADA